MIQRVAGLPCAWPKLPLLVEIGRSRKSFPSKNYDEITIRIYGIFWPLIGNVEEVRDLLGEHDRLDGLGGQETLLEWVYHNTKDVEEHCKEQKSTPIAVPGGETYGIGLWISPTPVSQNHDLSNAEGGSLCFPLHKDHRCVCAHRRRHG